MTLRTKSVVVVPILLLALVAVALGGCKDNSTDAIYNSTDAIYNSTTAIYGQSTTTTTERREPQTLAVAGIAKVEQGELSVSKITVTGDLASAEAKALLLTGQAGEGTNVSKAPTAGNEFLMVTFMYKKAEWYEFRGGVYPDDLLLKDPDGKEYPLVETRGYGGIYDTKAGEVKPNVEAFTTAVFEVPKGKTGLVLTYHTGYEDMFYTTIR